MKKTIKLRGVGRQVVRSSAVHHLFCVPVHLNTVIIIAVKIFISTVNSTLFPSSLPHPAVGEEWAKGWVACPVTPHSPYCWLQVFTAHGTWFNENYWWWVDGWTGWSCGSFPTLVILWFHDQQKNLSLWNRSAALANTAVKSSEVLFLFFCSQCCLVEEYCRWLVPQQWLGLLSLVFTCFPF